MRQEVRGRMAYLLPPGTILCLPTTPFPAPLRGQPLSVLDPLRDRITCLCAQGGLAGHPQVSLPARRSMACRSACRSSARAAAMPCWSPWRAPWRRRRERSDTEHSRSRRRGARAVRALRAGADRQERRGARRHLLEQPAHDPSAPTTSTATASTASTPIAWRAPPGPGTKEKRLRLEIVTAGPRHRHRHAGLQGARPGHDRPADPDLGALPRCGWKVIAAHVSMIGETPVL